jgi:hypothetical protein
VSRPAYWGLPVRLNLYRSLEYRAIRYRSINRTLPAIHDGIARWACRMIHTLSFWGLGSVPELKIICRYRLQGCDVFMPAVIKPASISWGEVLKRPWKEAQEDDVFGRSAQVAYYFFLAFLSPFDLCYRGIRSLRGQGRARSRGGPRLFRKLTSWFCFHVSTEDSHGS